MAFMNQEKKRAIKQALDAALPKGWTVTLKVDRYTSLRATIKKAPIDLMQFATADERERGYYHVNHYHLNNRFTGETLEIMTKLVAALNTGNWDRSDAMYDHFDVGHYLNISVGSYQKPFVQS